MRLENVFFSFLKVSWKTVFRVRGPTQEKLAKHSLSSAQCDLCKTIWSIFYIHTYIHTYMGWSHEHGVISRTWNDLVITWNNHILTLCRQRDVFVPRELTYELTQFCCIAGPSQLACTQQTHCDMHASIFSHTQMTTRADSLVYVRVESGCDGTGEDMSWVWR